MRKGEIACYKQFSSSHNVFHSYISLVRQNAALCGNWLNLPETASSPINSTKWHLIVCRLYYQKTPIRKRNTYTQIREYANVKKVYLIY